MIAKAGFPVQEISHDYGEDLLVQLSHAGEIDATRLWIQVKGTESIDRYRRIGGFGYTVPFEHAIKWARSADPVIFVLWDVEADCGYYAWPGVQVDEWQPLESGQKRTTVRLEEDDRLTPEQVEKIAWEAREGHFWSLVAGLRRLKEELDEDGDDGAIVGDRILVLSLDFAMKLGIVEQMADGAQATWSAAEQVTEDFAAELEDRFDDDVVEDVELTVIGALTIALMRQVERSTPLKGLMRVTIEQMLDVLARVFPIQEMIAAGEASIDDH